MNIANQYENAEILPNISDKSPIFFQCDHATNILPEPYKWTQNDSQHFMNEHWAIDTGALKLAKYLSSQTNSVLVHSKYTRLLCDVNRQLQSENLCRTEGDGKIIELNQDLTQQELLKRAQYHSSYQLAIREVIHKVRPKYIYSIHSFNPIYEGKIREVEVGILTSLFDEFGQKHQKPILDAGFDCRINEPYTGKKGLNYSIDNSCLALTPCIQGTLFEVRNDLLQTRFEEVANAILNAIKVNI